MTKEDVLTFREGDQVRVIETQAEPKKATVVSRREVFDAEKNLVGLELDLKFESGGKPETFEYDFNSIHPWVPEIRKG